MDSETANRGPSSAAPALNVRRQTLLEIIVSDYIETAVPVASEQLARRYELRVSPATVRNDMAELEEMGYISRPHASAGGVPSDPGYRFYVDRAAQHTRLPRRFDERVRHAINVEDADPAAWARNAARVLSSAVQNLTIATTVKPSIARVKQVQLVHLHDSDALLIVVMQEARVRQRMVRFDSPIEQETLTAAANHLNRFLTGKSAAGLRALRETDQLADPIHEAAVAETLRILSDEERDETQQHYTNGLRQLLDQPEFRSTQSAQDAAQVLEDDSLPKLLAEPVGPTEVRVVIGEESHNEHLRPYSVVYAAYGIPGDARGVIGALGPTRMDYARAMASVRHLAAFLSELLQALDPSPA